MDKVKKSKTKLELVGDIVSTVIIVILCLLTIISFVEKSKDLVIFKYRPVVVASGSMEPCLATDSLVILKSCGIDDIVVGDIVVYRSKVINNLIIHRIVNDCSTGEEKLFEVKGDANSSSDVELVNKDNIMGKVVKTMNWTVPYLRCIIEGGRLKPIGIMQLGISLFFIIIVVSLGSKWVYGRVTGKKELDIQDNKEENEDGISKD